MAKYESLTRLLPKMIDLDDVAELARELDISAAHEEPDAPDDEYGREWERFSLYHLLDGLYGANLPIDHAEGRVLVIDWHWKDYARDYAEGIADISHVDTYVDWQRYADDMRADYAEVEITDGEFRGTWYVRG